MENLIFFHEHAIFIIIIITSLILYVIINIIMNDYYNRFLIKGHFIEIVWTIIPVILLFFLAIPSLKILYLTDELINPILIVKSIGNQWYWSYEYENIDEFDSFIIKDYNNYNFRLLDVDNVLILPNNLEIRILVTSNDVIHSFTLSSLGIKADAIPGRLNQIILYLNRCGIFYGQCSEICGVNHSFIPIVLESINFKNYLSLINL